MSPVSENAWETDWKIQSWWSMTGMNSITIVHLRTFTSQTRHNHSWHFSPNCVNGHWVQCQESWYHQAKAAVLQKVWQSCYLFLYLVQLPGGIVLMRRHGTIINLELRQLNHFMWWNYTITHINAQWRNSAFIVTKWHGNWSSLDGGGETDLCLSEQWGCFKEMECSWWDGMMFDMHGWLWFIKMLSYLVFGVLSFFKNWCQWPHCLNNVCLSKFHLF